MEGNNWKGLPFAYIVNMLEFKLTENNDEQRLRQFYHLLTQMTGDPSGKISAIAMPFLIMQQKSPEAIEHIGIRDVFDDVCTFEEAKKYASDMKAFYKSKLGPTTPCLNPEKNACCGFFDKVITDNLEYLLIVMKYTVPSFHTNHSVLAKFLGFDGNKDYGNLGQIAKTAPFCALPGTDDSEPCLDKDMRVFFTTEGVCASINAPPMNKIYKVGI